LQVCVILPTYNEVETIEEVVCRIESLGLDTGIVIVDDGSMDGTRKRIDELRTLYDNITLLERGHKLGLGSAIKCGMKTALSFQSPPEYIVTMDCDLSHEPNDIPRLLDLAKASKADIVVGSRYVENGEIVGWNLYRKLLSFSSNFITRLLLGLQIHDCTSGFKVYRRRVVEKILPQLHTSAYEAQVETLYCAKKLGLRIREAPIVFRDRTSGQSKLGKTEITCFLRYVIETWIRSIF